MRLCRTNPSRIEIITGHEERRRYSAEHKLQLVEEAIQPGMTVSAVAQAIYGYRRITALLNRARRASGAEPVNHKRIFRLMRQARLLLRPYTGLRPMQAHKGNVIALPSNHRWSSDVLEIACWNGEVVRVAFAIDTCDREIITWHAITGGTSGEMVRDLMLACVEPWFAAIRAPHPVQWLADNGSAYTAT